MLRCKSNIFYQYSPKIKFFLKKKQNFQALGAPSLGDFPPISLLSVFSKVFEKIIETTKFVNKNNILTPLQFGFRENSSTDLAVTTFYDKLLNSINDGKITCSMFLDLKKACDSVDITILIKKIRHYGFGGPAFNLLLSYLT